MRQLPSAEEAGEEGNDILDWKASQEEKEPTLGEQVSK